MAELRGDLDLTIDDALGGIAQIEAQLDQVVQSFSTDLASALDQLSTITTEVPPVEIDADTTPAQESISALGQEATGASSEVSSLEGSVTALDAASGAAQGNLQGVASAIGGISKGAATAVAAYAAIGGAATLFFTEAAQAQGQTERFQTALGGLASSVERVNVGDLNADLGQLAISLGSDDDALRSTAATMFQMGRSAGAAAPEVAETTEQIIALAARAVALNPELGTVDSVVQRMSRGMARGGRFAAQYGLDLSRAEISSRALADTGKDSADQLTFYEQVVAGAAIATEKYGDTLQDTIATGQQNTLIVLASLKQQISEVFEALGAPLVAPGLELLDDARPAIEAAGAILQRLALAILPAAQAALRGVTPLLETVVSVMDALPAPVLGAATNWFLLNRAFGPTAGLIGAFLPLLSAIDPALASAAVSIGLFATGGAKLAGVLPNVGSGMGTVAGIGVGLGQVVGGTAGNMISMASAGALLGQSLIPIPGVGAAAGAAVGVLGAALLGGGESAAEAREEISALAGELKGLAPAAAAARFLGDEVDTLALKAAQAGPEVTDAITDITTTIDVTRGRARAAFADMRRDLLLLAQESPGAAERVLAGLRDIGAQSGLTDQQLTILENTVARGTGKFAENAAASAEVSVRDRELADSATSAAEAQEAARAATEQFVSTAVGQIPTLDAVLQTTAGNLERFGIGLDNAASPEQFLADLQAATTGILNFQTNVETLISLGLGNIARLVVSQGPQVGGAFAQAVLNASPEVQAALNSQLGLYDQATKDYAAFLAGPGGATITAGYQQGLAGLPDMSAVGMAAAGQAITASTPGVVSTATTAGAQTGAGYGTGLSGQQAPIGTAAQSAVGSVASNMSIDSFFIGQNVGFAFATGLEDPTTQERVRGAANTLAQIAKSTLERALKIESPSKVFADLGRQTGLGYVEGLEDSALAVERATQRLAARAIPETLTASEIGRAVARALPASTGESSGRAQVVVVHVDSLDDAARLVGADTSHLEA